MQWARNEKIQHLGGGQVVRNQGNMGLMNWGMASVKQVGTKGGIMPQSWSMMNPGMLAKLGKFCS